MSKQKIDKFVQIFIVKYKIQIMNKEQEDERKILKDKNNDIQYIRGKLLGTGGFAKCFEVISQGNQQIYAAKVIPKKSINQKRQRYKLLVEIKIHRSLKHKHIVQFIETFEDRENVYILLQYCQNYTLKDLVKRRKRITEYETRIYIEQIVKALVYIHSHSIIHRDLKLGNILINQHMDTKICDFGLSTRVKHEGQVKKTICGTPNYIAPQILEENGHSYEVDIWSIGVIMYTLLFGKPPFQDNTVEQTYENIKNNRFTYPPTIPISSMAKDMINKILVTNPSKRISLNQILEHSFMRHRQEMPKQLPSYTIAIPPLKIMQIQSRQLSVHDTNYELSEQMANNSMDQKLQKTLKQNINTKATKAPHLYIRQCFFFEDIFGYLLSNGFMGILYKKTGMNVLLEYGACNYYIFSKNNMYIPIKKSLPSDHLQPNHLIKTDYLEHLLNFRSFFITKYGVFKLDQLRKKYLATAPQSGTLSQEQEDLVYIKKIVKLNKGQVLTRMSNSVIQLHFNDLTNIAINQEENEGIFYMNEKGKLEQVHYNQCSNKNIKTKVRMFSNLLQKVSKASHNQNQLE